MLNRYISTGIIFVTLSVGFVNLAFAQSNDSTRKVKDYKNVIKVNLTSNILYRSPLIEYERLVSRNQSFSLQFGLVALPFGSTLGSDSMSYKSTVKKAGFSVTGDYRFYLKKENKDPAPHGVYVGPYVAYLTFDNQRNMTVGASQNLLLLDTKLQVFSVGAQLGYQFVLGKKKHWTIDCIVVGPSLTRYIMNMKLTGTIDPSKIDENLQKILEGIASQFPLIGDLLRNQEANFTGHSDSWSAGFRYSIHAGYRF
jgi:hypothetical protein